MILAGSGESKVPKNKEDVRLSDRQILLFIYFSSLIAVSAYVSFLFWNPDVPMYVLDLNSKVHSALEYREARLLVFSACFGVMGASINGIACLTAWISTNKLKSEWVIWYLKRPPIGAALAIIAYFIVRAGFVSGGPTAISDFGVAGLSALVGLMTNEITSKLRDVFDSLFGIEKPDAEKGDIPTKKDETPPIIIETNKTQAKGGGILRAN